MRRLPRRARLALAFAAAMAAVIAAAGAFVHARMRADLDESLTATLAARADAAAALSAAGWTPYGPGGEPEEAFEQALDAGGRVVWSAGGVTGPALTAAERRAATRGEIVRDRRVAGIEGKARLLARPVDGEGAARVVAVGRSLEDRDETLSALVTSFAIGGPAVMLLAGLAGYALAGAALRPAVERERRFVADASHELRTPIAVMKTELETLARRGDLDDEAREGVAAAVGEADRLGALAEDLLVLARGAEGALPVRPEPLELRDLLEGVRARFADRATAAGREVRVEVARGLRASGDPLRLRQALGNLVDNALRHGAGTVTLAARAARGAAEIEVRDEGPGFPAGLAERAFERFTRGDEARSGGGAGLGLAIVRAIAQAHGGTAEIAAGGGGRVLLRLPDGASHAHLRAPADDARDMPSDPREGTP